MADMLPGQEEGRGQLDTMNSLRVQLRQQADQLAVQKCVSEQLLHAVGTAVCTLGTIQQKPSQIQQQEVQAVFEQLSTAHCAALKMLSDLHATTLAEAEDVTVQATAASALLQQSPDALYVLLQHCEVWPSGSLCALLCDSRDLQALIHQCCKGKLVMNAQHPERDITWITKHGGLLKELELGERFSAGGIEAVVSAVTAAAAATPGGLKLQSFMLQSSCSDSMVLSTLADLCSSTLTHLDLSSSGTAEQVSIAPIALMTALRSLRLAGSWNTDINTAAAAWEALPLRVLELSHFNTTLSMATMQQLGRFQGITKLVFRGTDLEPATMQQLKAALCGFTQLQLVCLEGWRLGRFGVATIAAVPGVKELECTTVEDLPFGLLDCTATQLTRLDLLDCKLTATAMGAIASCCPALQRLNLRGSKGVTNAAVSAIAQLTDLTHLELNRTNVTDIGVLQLSCLAQLQKLHL